jgi:hypothetical protein
VLADKDGELATMSETNGAIEVLARAGWHYGNHVVEAGLRIDPHGARVLLLIIALLCLGYLIDYIMTRSGSVTASHIGAADQYDQQAEAYRAMKRQLDAEAAYTESYIRTMRSRAELEELSEVVEHEKAKRRMEKR